MDVDVLFTFRFFSFFLYDIFRLLPSFRLARIIRNLRFIACCESLT